MNQLALIVLTALSGTRVVIFLLGVFIIIKAYRSLSNPKQTLWHVCLAFLLIGSFIVIMPARYMDSSDTAASISYRSELQTAALSASLKEPLLGYGPGNLADALNCNKLTASPLQESCDDGFFFNSSHNIFLDRVLMIGWPGGIAFMAFVLFAIFRSFTKPETRSFALAALLISMYYVTNVTSVSLELLLWVLLVACLMTVHSRRA
jgi:O-antigen ligase